MKKILISGITGQLGSALCEYYLKNYQDVHVYGMKRRCSNFNTQRLDHLYDDPELSKRLTLMYGDITDEASVSNIVSEVKPDVFFNTAAQSHVQISYTVPIATAMATGISVLICLEAVKRYSQHTKFIQCSSSEMFGGKPETVPQNELTPFTSMSPYATSKIFGYHSVVNYRNAFNLHASNAIMFNYESENRGINFISRKISWSLARIFYGLQKKLYVGNIHAMRDWSYIQDTIRALDLMAAAETPDDYCIATGQSHSVEEFLEKAFNHVGMNWRDYVEIDPKYFRPQEVHHLKGDYSKIKDKLGWEPKVFFDDLVKIMVDHDMKLVEKEIKNK